MYAVPADATMRTCCLEPNNTITLTSDDTFHTPEYGDFTITYDVLASYSSNYKAQVIVPSSHTCYSHIILLD